MAAAVLVQLPVVLLLEVFSFTALLTLKGEIRPSFSVAHQQELSYLLLRVHRHGVGLAQIFFGLSFIPFGILVLRSGFMARMFSILLIVSGIGYITDSCTYILLQRPDYLLVRQFLVYTFAGFGLTMLWLLVKGIKTSNALHGK